jgi:hypothetical protein
MGEIRPNGKNSPKWQKFAQMLEIRPNGKNSPKWQKYAQMAEIRPNVRNSINSPNLVAPIFRALRSLVRHNWLLANGFDSE